MDTEKLKNLANYYNTARANIWVVVLFSAINLVLTLGNTGRYVLFSAMAPLAFFEYSRAFAEIYRNELFYILGAVMAAIIIIIYFVFWLLSKRFRVFILVSLIYFSFDCLLVIYLIFINGFDRSWIFDIIFHIWIMFVFIKGTEAWAGLRKADPELVANLIKKDK